jgi:hypothetical protein
MCMPGSIENTKNKYVGLLKARSNNVSSGVCTIEPIRATPIKRTIRNPGVVVASSSADTGKDGNSVIVEDMDKLYENAKDGTAADRLMAAIREAVWKVKKNKIDNSKIYTRKCNNPCKGCNEKNFALMEK